MRDSFSRELSLLDPLPPEEGPDKTMTLPEALARLVKPGMHLHFSTTHNRGGAVVLELIRAFRGKAPGFTFSCIGFVGTGVALVHAGLAKKLITTFCGDSYPTPGPNPVINRAWLSGELEIENWSILTLPLRLMAAAMGVPGLFTKSLVGSSMAEHNRHAFEEVSADDGGQFGMVKPLRPDLSFIHAPCADRAGNALLTPPYGEEALGAYAAKEGVVVTVEKVVSTDFIRRYSHLCRIPSYLVRAVCEVPFAAHPGGVSNRGLPEIPAYADDYEFVEEVRAASKTPESMDRWLQEWVDDCPAWDDYLRKLGKDRLWALRGKADADSWKSELLSLMPGISREEKPAPVEAMVAAAAKVISERMKKSGLETILAGVGASNLAAWLAYYRLKQEGYHAELMAEIGFYGYAPRPADPFIFNYRNMPASKMLTGIPSIMGVFMAGAGNRCLGSIGAGQVDEQGNINTTLIPGRAYLTGSGGANDICSGASEVVVSALSGKNRLVSRLPYITSPGRRVKAVVCELGVLEKPEGGDKLILTRLLKRGEEDLEARVREMKNRCGWELKVAREIAEIPPPNPEELALIRLFDPKAQFLGKARD